MHHISTPRIHSEQKAITVLVRLQTEPDKADQLLELMEALSSVCEQQPEFICSALHLSRDGTKILSYQQWGSENAYDSYLRSKERKEPLRAIQTFIDAGYASEVSWDTYNIEYLSTRPQHS